MMDVLSISPDCALSISSRLATSVVDPDVALSETSTNSTFCTPAPGRASDNSNSKWPATILSPMPTGVAVSIRRSLTRVPFLLPRSSAIHCPFTLVSAMCWRDNPASSG
jgi:hypothetical protein